MIKIQYHFFRFSEPHQNLSQYAVDSFHFSFIITKKRMSFRRPHPRQRRTCEEHKAELEEENHHLRSKLQTEVDTNRQNERRINQLERDYSRCEQEIQDLNSEIERLENASKEEIVELKSEISTLKSQLYQVRKDVRDKGKYISSLEEQLVESEEQVEKLRCRIRTISSRKKFA